MYETENFEPERDEFTEVQEILDEMSWPTEFAEQPTIQSVIDKMTAEVQKDFEKPISLALRGVISQKVFNELDCLIRYHEQPWFSEGIKAEIAQMGVPVTKEEVLDAAFRDTDIKEKIEYWGRIQALVRLKIDLGDAFEFKGYTLTEIEASWKRLGIVND